VLKTPMNLQDSFLNNARKEKVTVTIRLLNGNSLSGIIQGFDNFAIILKHKTQELVYKHAISTIIPQKDVFPFRDGNKEGNKEEKGFTTEPRIKPMKGKKEEETGEAG